MIPVAVVITALIVTTFGFLQQRDDTGDPVVADEYWRALEQTGMRCVRGVDDPVINICRAGSVVAQTEARWMSVDGGLVRFEVSGVTEPGSARRRLTDRLRVFTGAAPGADNRALDDVVRQAGGSTQYRMQTDWGVIEIGSFEQRQGIRITGTVDGPEPPRVPYPEFLASEADLSRILGSAGFRCTARSLVLNCHTGDTSFIFPRSGESERFRSLLVLRGGAWRESLARISDPLFGPERRPVLTMISDNADAEHFLGVTGGYLIEINAETDTITVETIGW